MSQPETGRLTKNGGAGSVGAVATASQVGAEARGALTAYESAMERLGAFFYEASLCANSYGDPKYTDDEISDLALQNGGELVKRTATELRRYCSAALSIPGRIDPCDESLRDFVSVSESLASLCDINPCFQVGGEQSQLVNKARDALTELWKSLGLEISRQDPAISTRKLERAYSTEALARPITPVSPARSGARP